MAKTVSYNFSITTKDTALSSSSQVSSFLELIAADIPVTYDECHRVQIAASGTPNVSPPTYVFGGSAPMEVVIFATYTDGSIDQYVTFTDTSTTGTFHRMLSFRTEEATLQLTNESDGIVYLSIYIRKI